GREIFAGGGDLRLVGAVAGDTFGLGAGVVGDGGDAHRVAVRLFDGEGGGLGLEVAQAEAEPVVHGPAVVVHGGAEYVQRRALAGLEHGLARVFESGELAGLPVEDGAEILAGYGGELAIFGNGG